MREVRTRRMRRFMNGSTDVSGFWTKCMNMIIIQHPGKKIKIRSGELAHQNVFDLFSWADKARSDSEAHSPGCAAFGTVGC